MGKLFLGKGSKLDLFCFDFKIIQHVKIFKQIFKTAQNNAEKKKLEKSIKEVKKIVFDLISLYLSLFAFTIKFYKTFRIAKVLFKSMQWKMKNPFTY